MVRRLACTWLGLFASSVCASAAQDLDAAHARALEVARDLERARNAGAPERELEALRASYAAHVAALGGDDVANASLTPSGSSGPSGPSFLVAPTCGAVPQTSTFVGTSGPIPTTSSVAYTLVVSGLGTFLWDVDLRTFLTHTACLDLDVTLISPAGTSVVITTDNGGVNDDCFNGTLWDDNVNAPATEYTYTNLVTATPLSPEGRLEAFRGENPNGTWTLRIADDALANTGTLTSWSLDVAAFAGPPGQLTGNFVNVVNLPLADNGLTNSALLVSGMPSFLTGVKLYVEILHTFCADLDIRLVSPAGTSVSVTSDEGGSFDNVFNGTMFDPDVDAPVTDRLYSNLVTATPLSPEGSFDNFVGQNPNGTWTLAVTDDATGNVGTLVRWDLSVRAGAAFTPPSKITFSAPGGAIPEFGAGPTVNFTANVSGLGNYLWDLDMFTQIAHGACGDLDITLTSPAGTTVFVTSDNGFTGGVFNGTLFDDNANDPVTDHFYTLNVVATPLSPEGRFTAFRGENPNGTWTLGVTDDSTAVSGSLVAWSLDVSTISFAPTTSTSTFTNSPNVPIPDLGSVTDTINVSGLGSSLAKVVLYTEIPHTWSDDLDVRLTSPAGTTVAVTTDNAGNLDDVFNGTTWDPALALAPSEYPYVDLVVATQLAPEGSFDNFLGQNPNGNWTLFASDDFGNDTGTLVRWDLRLSTCSISTPTSYCAPNAPGSSAGCVPTISAGANPNVSQSNTCVVTVASVEGAKSGIIFYGILGPQGQAWCPTGNSFLCVKPPTQRTAAQNSGGNSGLCNGSLTLDWNAFQNANPTALGNPWSVGATAHVQGWFRDPASCKTTFLSEALELTYQP